MATAISRDFVGRKSSCAVAEYSGPDLGNILHGNLLPLPRIPLGTHRQGSSARSVIQELIPCGGEASFRNQDSTAL